MTKQEFMAMSLPYGLKWMYRNSKDKRIFEYTSDRYAVEFEFGLNSLNFIPILHPLSDLTKEIEHGGETFVPVEVLSEMNDGYDVYVSEFGVSIDNDYSCTYNLNVAFSFIQKLIEWHFAIGVDECDYVDVNTLKTNPYKIN